MDLLTLFDLNGYHQSLLLFFCDVGLHLNRSNFLELCVLDECGSVSIFQLYISMVYYFFISICHIYGILSFISVAFSIISWIFIIRVFSIIITLLKSKVEKRFGDKKLCGVSFFYDILPSFLGL